MARGAIADTAGREELIDDKAIRERAYLPLEARLLTTEHPSSVIPHTCHSREGGNPVTTVSREEIEAGQAILK